MNDAAKRARVAAQLRQVGTAARVTCGCGKTLPILLAYRCFWCGEWFCPACARDHFGPRPAKELPA
jgi:hypothetical protein